MSAVVSEWYYHPSGFEKSPITVPAGHGPYCVSDHPAGWVCTRRRGHTGRHAAHIADGEVVAVWR